MKPTKSFSTRRFVFARHVRAISLFAGGALLTLGGSLCAQTTYTYTGGATGDLNSTANYSPSGAVPSSTATTSDTIVFSSGATNLSLTNSATNFGGTTGNQEGIIFNVAAAQNGTVTLPGNIRLASVLMNSGAGGLTLNGNYNIGGPTGVATSNSITNNSSNGLVFNGGSTVAPGNASATATRTLAIDGTGRVVIAGTLGNSNAFLAVTKSNTGTFVINAGTTVTYTGATTINGGTFQVLGSTAAGSAVSVNNSGTILNGTGTVGGVVTVNSGALLQGGVGTATGTLTLTSTPVLNSGSVIGLTLGTGNTHSTLALPTGFTAFQTNQAFTLTGLQAGSYASIITGVGSGITTSGWTVINGSGYSYSFTDDTATNSIDLTVAAVPEPSTWMAGIVCLVVAGAAKRRRQAC